MTTRVGQRAGMRFASNSASIEAGEITDSLNEGIAELYDLFTSTEGQPWYLESTNFSTVGNTDTYTIGPGQAINIADFYKPRGVDIQYGQNIVNTARPFMWGERNRYKWLPGWLYNTPVAYRMMGKASTVAAAANDAIKFVPIPPGTFQITLWYTPTPPILVGGGDSFDGVNGWEEYAVLSAAVKLLLRQEQLEHASVLMQERERQKDRILGALMNRDDDAPERVTDVTLNDGWIGRPVY